MRYTNYHRHSMYSNLVTPDSTLKPIDYINRALELGHDCVSVMEHGHTGSMTEILEMYTLAQEHGLKLIIGAECYYVPSRLEKDRSNRHIVVFALNHDGLRQLNSIISEANTTGYYYKARVDDELLLTLNPDDFIITSACVGGIGNDEKAISLLYNHFKDNLFLELQSHNHPVQIEYNKTSLQIADKYGIKLIHGNDTHYITKQDQEKRRIFLKGKKMDYGDESEFESDYPHYDEILERYRKQGVVSEDIVIEAISNTNIIRDKTITFTFNKDIKMPTLYKNKTHEEKMDILDKTVKSEFRNQYQGMINTKEEFNKYLTEIDYELDIVRKTKMEDYFLTNYKGIKLAKEKGGILTRTGRGSGVSFLINKILGFTEIDRLQENVHLYPTRFMSVSRILETKSLPDIDFNCVNPKVFAQACKDLLGEHSCYVMYSAGTMQLKSSFKNVCRAYDIPVDIQNQISKDIEAYRHDDKYKNIIELAESMVGVIDSISPNPCGYLILNEDVREEVGIVKVGDELACLIDKNTADEWKYLKNDFLKVEVWDIISQVYKEINKPIDNIFELNRLTKNNEKVWNLYRDGITATLNQTSTDFARPLVMKYKPKTNDELTAFVAGIRPSFASMMSYLLERKPFSYGIEEFDKILESSQNFVLYQENIMATLVFAGFPEDETYGLIKAISKKKEHVIKAIRDRFVDGFVTKTGSEENALKVWQIIEDASAYGFNSSHALAVAYDSVYGAYLKATYPLEYYKVVLNMYQDDKDMTQKLTEELKYFNISISDPKFGHSKSEYNINYESNTIYKGMASIPFMSETVANELYELRNISIKDAIDLFIILSEQTTMNSRQTEILIKIDFFNKFGGEKYLLELYERFKKRYSKKHKEATKEKRIEEIYEFSKQITLDKFNVSEKVSAQIEYMGYISIIDNTISENIGVVVGLTDKYANRWITLYYPYNGERKMFKINKNLIEEYKLEIGVIMSVDQIEHKFKKTLSEGKWISSDVQEPHVKLLTIYK